MLSPRRLLKGIAHDFLSERTIALIRFDLTRRRTRLRMRGEKGLHPSSKKLHFGCGSRKIEGWLNVDLDNSDYDVDLACSQFPWRDDSFEIAMSQHVIEHLELKSELFPLLKELKRVLVEGGEIWLSCPDIEKICKSYNEHRMSDLIDDRQRRSRLHWGGEWSLVKEVGTEGVPSSHMINSLFYQDYEHRNLFDFNLLKWVLNICGFTDVERVDEKSLLERFPEIPERNDDKQSLYVRAHAIMYPENWTVE